MIIIKWSYIHNIAHIHITQVIYKLREGLKNQLIDIEKLDLSIIDSYLSCTGQLIPHCHICELYFKWLLPHLSDHYEVPEALSFFEYFTFYSGTFYLLNIMWKLFLSNKFRPYKDGQYLFGVKLFEVYKCCRECRNSDLFNVALSECLHIHCKLIWMWNIRRDQVEHRM